jgi:hypothetical protein
LKFEKVQYENCLTLKMFRLEIIKIKKPNLKSSISKNIQFKICSNSKNSNKKMFESEKCSNLKKKQNLKKFMF